MGSFAFKLERKDGTPADPPTLDVAVPNWSAGDTIPLGRRNLRAIGVCDDDEAPVLVVDDVSRMSRAVLADPGRRADRDLRTRRQAPPVNADLRCVGLRERRGLCSPALVAYSLRGLRPVFRLSL
jgi:hypothetical protein